MEEHDEEIAHEMKMELVTHHQQHDDHLNNNPHHHEQHEHLHKEEEEEEDDEVISTATNSNKEATRANTSLMPVGCCMSACFGPVARVSQYGKLLVSSRFRGWRSAKQSFGA